MIERFLIPASWNKHEDSYAYRDAESKREYSRIVGGMAWPHRSPGYAVVLGQSRFTNPQTKLPDISIIAEHEDSDVMDLLRQCAAWTKDMQCSRWYGNTEDFGMMRILHRFNEKRVRPLSIIPALGEDEQREFDFYVNLIKIAASSNRKVLQFREARLREKMMELTQDVMGKNPKCEDFPAVSALGYALSAMEMFKDGPARFAGAYVPLDSVLGY